MYDVQASYNDDMSTFNELDIACEECGEEFKGTIWTAIHAGQDPELKDMLLGGELNMVMCPKCSHVAYQDHFVLYQDPPAELAVYIYPPSQQSEEEFLRKAMHTSFHEAQELYGPKERKNYEPILIFGMEALVQMMEEEELRAEQSQIAQEICKANKIATILLRPSEARRLATMRVIPRTGKSEKPSRQDILKGLDKLLELNPALDLYSKLRFQIQSNPAWATT